MAMIPASIWTVAQTILGTAVLLRPEGTETVVPIYIGLLEAQSILYGLAGKKPERPLTHDLVVSAFGELGVGIIQIEITQIQDNTFFARLHLTQGDREYSIDARPSDCMALAVRAKCPIFIDEEVVSSTGRSMSEINIKGSEEAPDAQTAVPELDRLKAQLKVAVDAENYEEAATLRDQIRQLEENA